MNWLRMKWAELLCAAGWHAWEEESRWVGPATILNIFVVNLEYAPQGIDFCSRCGQRQKFLLNESGHKNFPEFIDHDQRYSDGGADTHACG